LRERQHPPLPHAAWRIVEPARGLAARQRKTTAAESGIGAEADLSDISEQRFQIFPAQGAADVKIGLDDARRVARRPRPEFVSKPQPAAAGLGRLAA
jgi:hypothetical protein